MSYKNYMVVIYTFLIILGYVNSSKCNELKNALTISLDQNPQNLTLHQKCLKRLFRLCIPDKNNSIENGEYGIEQQSALPQLQSAFLSHNFPAAAILRLPGTRLRLQPASFSQNNEQLDYPVDEELLANLVANENTLTSSELAVLITKVEESTENIDSDLNVQCVICQYWYRKNVLFKYEHNDKVQVPSFHYATCFPCEKEYGDLHNASRCALCRRPSKKQLPDFLVQQGRVIRMGVFDGSALAMPISSFFMAVLSTCIAQIDEFGEFSDEYPAMFDIQNFNRNTWWYIFAVSSFFVYHGRKSVSLLLDYRGLSFLLLPILNTIISLYDQNIASYLSMVTLLSIFVQLLVNKNNFIISNRLHRYFSNFPEKMICSNWPARILREFGAPEDLLNFSCEQYHGMNRFIDNLLNFLLYINLWGSIATAETGDAMCKSGEGEYGHFKGSNLPFFESLCNITNGKIGKSWISISRSFSILLIFMKLFYNFIKKKSFLNYTQGLYMLTIGLIMNLNKGIEKGFMVVNMLIFLVVGCMSCCVVGTVGDFSGRRNEMDNNNNVV